MLEMLLYEMTVIQRTVLDGQKNFAMCLARLSEVQACGSLDQAPSRSIA